MTILNLEPGRIYTIEEFLDLPDDGKRYELIEGDLKEMPGPNFEHGDITVKIIALFFSFLAREGNAGGKVLTNMAFVMDQKNVLLPDVAFVSESRLGGIDRKAAFPGSPDIAIEIMSPTDKWSEVSDKVRRYLRAGTKLVWIVDPFDRAVNEYRLESLRRTFFEKDELEGADVLPGFKLKVSELFEQAQV